MYILPKITTKASNCNTMNSTESLPERSCESPSRVLTTPLRIRPVKERELPSIYSVNGKSLKILEETRSTYLSVKWMEENQRISTIVAAIFHEPVVAASQVPFFLGAVGVRLCVVYVFLVYLSVCHYMYSCVSVTLCVRVYCVRTSFSICCVASVSCVCCCFFCADCVSTYSRVFACLYACVYVHTYI